MEAKYYLTSFTKCTAMLKPLNDFPMKLVLLHQYKVNYLAIYRVRANDIVSVLGKQSRSTRHSFPDLFGRLRRSWRYQPFRQCLLHRYPLPDTNKTRIEMSPQLQQRLLRFFAKVMHQRSVKILKESKCFKVLQATISRFQNHQNFNIQFRHSRSAPPTLEVASFSGATCVASPRDVKIPISMPTSERPTTIEAKS